MAISRFKTSTLAQGLPKYQDVWDGISVVETFVESDFELISRTTVGSTSVSSISFSSIPSTYRHLQVRYVARSTIGTAGEDDMYFTFNGSSSNYSWRRMLGDGASVTRSGATGLTSTRLSAAAISRNGNTSGIFSAGIIDIFDYTNTSKAKTFNALYGNDRVTAGGIAAGSGAWYGSTDAINSISFTIENSNSFVQHTSFALYGIKGA